MKFFAVIINEITRKVKMARVRKSRIYKGTITNDHMVYRYGWDYVLDLMHDRILKRWWYSALSRVTGNALYDRERNDDIRRKCEVKNIGDWTYNREKKEWGRIEYWQKLGIDHLYWKEHQGDPKNHTSIICVQNRNNIDCINRLQVY